MKNSVELKYINGYKIDINEEKDELFYHFDYDVRSYDLNMEFQHFHNFYELLIPLDDKISHIIEGRYFDLNVYDLVLLKPSRLHKSKYHEGLPRKRIIINFNIPSTMFGLAGDLKNILSIFDADIPIYRFSVEDRQSLFNILNEIITLHLHKSNNNRLLIHTKFIEFLALIFKNKSKNLYTVEQNGNSITQKIYDVSSFIHLNLNTDLNLNDIADNFSISPCYLSHQFKEVTGFTLVNYIQMTRVREVQRLLLHSTKQIKDIGDLCGFNSFSQFNRVFRKYVKMSPSQFRKAGDANIRNLIRFKEFD